jgi:transposase
METLHSLQKVTAGIDVHRMIHAVTVLIEHDDGSVTKEQRQFGGFKRDKRAMVAWLVSLGVQCVVMESTGIYWKSAYAFLERAGIPTWVVNAYHVKHVPGRKTDMADSEWLAILGRFGLVRGSFIPPQDLRELRLVSRYRRKLASILAAEKNRLHKVLDDAGIVLGAVVSDIDGGSARRMIQGLIAGEEPMQLAGLGLGALRAKQADLALALDGDLSPRHRFVLQQLNAHIRFLEQQLAEIDRTLFEAMAPYAWAWRLLQTIPGIDQVAAALILIEIGDDLSHFGSADRLASWAALCPGNHESAGKRKSGKTRKGNAVIRSILCECANAARRTQSVFGAKYRGLVVRRGHKKAIVALAHKLIRTIFFVLTRRQPYRDSGFDYEAANVAKNAPRWIKALKRYGYWPQVVATA